MMVQQIEDNALVLLWDGKKKHIVRARPEPLRLGSGTIDGTKLLGRRFGEEVELAGKKFVLLEPSLLDKLENLEREAQIITPKDAGVIVLNCCLKSGDVVVEGGSGSGALTIVLAHIVQPRGRVISYEKRHDFAALAARNVANAGLEKYVEFRHADITLVLDVKNVDAIILDIPNPWDVVSRAGEALKQGGYLASYSPTFNQVEQTVKKLRECGFSEIRTIETLQRELVVHEGGTRPSFEMLGHTGYVTIARKISKPQKNAKVL